MEDSPKHPGIIPILTLYPFIHKDSVLFVWQCVIKAAIILALHCDRDLTCLSMYSDPIQIEEAGASSRSAADPNL